MTSALLVRHARLFHALSDETRLRIVEQLQGGEQCVCHLSDALRAAQSLLSFHLKTLKDAGLIRDRRDGRWIYYSVDRETLADLQSLLHEIDRRIERAARTAARCE